MSGAIAQRANMTTKAARREGVVPVGDARRLLALEARRGHCHGRRRASAAGRCTTSSSRTARLRRRDARSAPRRVPEDGLFDVLDDRRPHEARPDDDDAEDLPRLPPAASQGGAAARRDGDGHEPEPLPVELDGEQPGTTPVRFELVPRALRLRVPGGRSLLRAREPSLRRGRARVRVALRGPE